MNDPIEEAMRIFEIPSEHIDFLFLIPPFYVAKADGKISVKEAMSISYNSITSGQVSSQGEESQVFTSFLQNKILQFQGKSNLSDLDVLAAAINARLAQFPVDKAMNTRKLIYDTCVKVAKASGPMFTDKVSAEENQMLDKIFRNIHEQS